MMKDGVTFSFSEVHFIIAQLVLTFSTIFGGLLGKKILQEFIKALFTIVTVHCIECALGIIFDGFHKPNQS